jgi:hypothetical protein
MASSKLMQESMLAILQGSTESRNNRSADNMASDE